MVNIIELFLVSGYLNMICCVCKKENTRTKKKNAKTHLYVAPGDVNQGQCKGKKTSDPIFVDSARNTLKRAINRKVL